MIPSLPQHDPAPEQRAAELATARDAYRYSYDVLPPMALSATVPPGDAPSMFWKVQVADAIVKLMINSALIRDEEHDHPEHPTNLAAHKGIRERVMDAMHRALDKVQSFAMTGCTSGRAESVAHFTQLFRAFPAPPIATNFTDPLVFARMRVAGPNPMQLHRVAAPPARFAVTFAHYRAVMGPGDSLEAAGAEGRLYLADYGVLAGQPCGTFPCGQKYAAAPLALFAVPPGRAMRDLCPIAIQLHQEPDRSHPIFTPLDGWGWAVAASFVNSADGNLHQAVHHLAHTHLVMEPMAIATRRHLSSLHPLAILLRPHFEGTLAINHAAVQHLIADGGGVDAVMAVKIDAARALAAKCASEWVFDDAMLPVALLRRGVDDPETLPYYPYRDDGLLLWQAIYDWVQGYLELYYPGSAEIQADSELQAWIAELSAKDGGRIKGIGQSGRIETFNYLVSATTLILFTASVQHAAVNFPQYHIMSFAPAIPLAAYHPPPRSKEGITEQTLLNMLPPLDQAHYQLALGYLLGSIHHTRLGNYGNVGLIHQIEETLLGAEDGDDDYFCDPRVQAPLAAFQRRLREIEQAIAERDTSRYPYPFLRPSQIPQSTNI